MSLCQRAPNVILDLSAQGKPASSATWSALTCSLESFRASHEVRPASRVAEEADAGEAGCGPIVASVPRQGADDERASAVGSTTGYGGQNIRQAVLYQQRLATGAHSFKRAIC